MPWKEEQQEVGRASRRLRDCSRSEAGPRGPARANWESRGGCMGIGKAMVSEPREDSDILSRGEWVAPPHRAETVGPGADRR